MKPKNIFLGADHAGFKLKEHVKEYLLKQHYNVEDKGVHSFDKNDDYPDFIKPVAREISKKPNEYKGIIFGASGQGESIAANRFKGVRAALYYGQNEEIIKLSRTHNDANMLSLGARFLSSEEAIKAVKLWLGTDFSNEKRHVRRIKKLG